MADLVSYLVANGIPATQAAGLARNPLLAAGFVSPDQPGQVANFLLARNPASNPEARGMVQQAQAAARTAGSVDKSAVLNTSTAPTYLSDAAAKSRARQAAWSTVDKSGAVRTPPKALTPGTEPTYLSDAAAKRRAQQAAWSTVDQPAVKKARAFVTPQPAAAASGPRLATPSSSAAGRSAVGASPSQRAALPPKGAPPMAPRLPVPKGASAAGRSAVGLSPAQRAALPPSTGSSAASAASAVKRGLDVQAAGPSAARVGSAVQTAGAQHRAAFPAAGLWDRAKGAAGAGAAGAAAAARNAGIGARMYAGQGAALAGQAAAGLGGTGAALLGLAASVPAVFFYQYAKDQEAGQTIRNLSRYNEGPLDSLAPEAIEMLKGDPALATALGKEGAITEGLLASILDEADQGEVEFLASEMRRGQPAAGDLDVAPTTMAEAEEQSIDRAMADAGRAAPLQAQGLEVQDEGGWSYDFLPDGDIRILTAPDSKRRARGMILDPESPEAAAIRREFEAEYREANQGWGEPAAPEPEPAAESPEKPAGFANYGAVEAPATKKRSRSRWGSFGENIPSQELF